MGCHKLYMKAVKHLAAQANSRMTKWTRKVGLLEECGFYCREDCLEEWIVGCMATVDNLTAVACREYQEIEWQQLDRVVDPMLLSKLL